MDYFDLLYGYIENDTFCWIKPVTLRSETGLQGIQCWVTQGAYFTHFLTFHG